jgi:hypothetical protein
MIHFHVLTMVMKFEMMSTPTRIVKMETSTLTEVIEMVEAFMA